MKAALRAEESPAPDRARILILDFRVDQSPWSELSCRYFVSLAVASRAVSGAIFKRVTPSLTWRPMRRTSIWVDSSRAPPCRSFFLGLVTAGPEPLGELTDDSGFLFIAKLAPKF